jgi:hypothetical protein
MLRNQFYENLKLCIKEKLLSLRLAGVEAEIRTENLANTNSESYLYTNLLSLPVVYL